jgi:hypothetical protein
MTMCLSTDDAMKASMWSVTKTSMMDTVGMARHLEVEDHLGRVDVPSVNHTTRRGRVQQIVRLRPTQLQMQRRLKELVAQHEIRLVCAHGGHFVLQ